MIFFSLVMFAFLTFFLLHTETTFNFMDVFYTVFFLLLMKSASDMHTHFISAPQAAYALSTHVPLKKNRGNRSYHCPDKYESLVLFFAVVSPCSLFAARFDILSLGISLL